uniref:Uncharacterized protein n=1 Tax=Nomascus leucogenys TaxID=61853 RepID=G1RLH4_NOMLE
MAQRRGRGPGGPQSTPRNPRGVPSSPFLTFRDAGGKLGQREKQPLTPSVNETVTGHPPFPAHSETVGSGLSSLGFPDWDPNTHAAYTDSPYSCPASAAENFLPPDFYPPSDPGQPCPFPQGMEAGPWRVSALPSGPPQFPAVVPGPSLEAARAHMLALGPQQLLAQDEEGDTLLHLFAARGLRWAAYAAAEVLQVYRRLDIREHKGKTPLLVAAAANQPLIVEDLLNLGAEPNAADHQGRSVLHVAATYGLPGVLIWYGQLAGRGLSGGHMPPRLANFCIFSRDGLIMLARLEIKSNKTVLHLAVQAANPTLVQLLLELPRGDLRTFVNMKVGAGAGKCRLCGIRPTKCWDYRREPLHLTSLPPLPCLQLRQLLKRSRVAPPGLSS